VEEGNVSFTLTTVDIDAVCSLLYMRLFIFILIVIAAAFRAHAKKQKKKLEQHYTKMRSDAAADRYLCSGSSSSRDCRVVFVLVLVAVAV